MLLSGTKVIYQSNGERRYMLVATCFNQTSTITQQLRITLINTMRTFLWNISVGIPVKLSPLVIIMIGERFSNNTNVINLNWRKSLSFFFNFKYQFSFSSSPSFVFFLYSQAARVISQISQSHHRTLTLTLENWRGHFPRTFSLFSWSFSLLFLSFRSRKFVTPLFRSFKKFRSFYFSQMFGSFNKFNKYILRVWIPASS